LISLTLALQPFEHFKPTPAGAMLKSLDDMLLEVASTIDAGESCNDISSRLAVPRSDWLSVEAGDSRDPLSRAFGLDSVDLRDDSREFSPARVFASHYLQNGQLLARIMPHMDSLGLPAVQDPLVLVSVIGWILSPRDEVAAYCALNALFQRLLATADKDVSKTALIHLEEMEPALRQGRFRVGRAVAFPPEDLDRESKALRLVEVYNLLIEGPVRQYGWLYHCLQAGNWSYPPTLSKLKEALASDGGWGANLAQRMILTNVRNGEAHQSLVWDGFHEVFIAEGTRVFPADVNRAAVLADAFARGCDAAVACYKALSVEPRSGAPLAGDPGRLASWRRAQALFGTNGIQVTKSNFNSTTATVTCSQFWSHNINPCFQALVCCQALLPRVQRFDIHTPGQSEAVLSVTADALRRAQNVWAKAATQFTSMPLSTFLPANLDSRRCAEPSSLAVRSVAWMAVDDLLDVFDGNPDEWNAEELDLAARRVELVEYSTQQCLAAVPVESQLRLREVHRVARDLSLRLRGLSAPLQRDAVDRMEQVQTARHWWHAWGPIERLPGVIAAPHFGVDHDKKPELLGERDFRWSTI
jgi:hypothetical protein